MNRNVGANTVAVTTTHGAESAVAAKLAERGFGVVEVPVISIVATNDKGVVAALRNLRSGDVVAVTSTNGARAVSRASLSRPRGVRVAAVGPTTAAHLEHAGWAADMVPATSTATDLAVAIGDPSGTGRVLFVSAEVPRPTLTERLTAAGWVVDRVVAYRTDLFEPDPVAVIAALGADAMTFTSGSTVRGWAAATPEAPPLVVSIGPSTSEAAIQAGFDLAIEAKTHTADGVVAAVERLFRLA